MIYEKHIECLSKEQLVSLQAHNLRVMIQKVFDEIPEYNRIIKKALNNKNCNTFDDSTLLDAIRSIPSTDKELYHSIDTSILNRLDRRLFYIDATSGSTGTPKSRFCSIEDDLHDTALVSRAFSSFCIDPHDRVLVYDLGDLTFYTQFTKALQDIGVKNAFFYGARHDFSASMEEALQLEPTVLITVPSLLLRSFKTFSDALSGQCTIKKYIYFGEGLDVSIISYFRTKFNIECFSLYGSTDIGWIGAECCAHDGIHCFSDSLLVDMENPVQSDISPFTRYDDPVMQGEAVFTSLFQIGKPDLRYKNGDSIVMTSYPCTCGRTTPRIKVLGRSADTFTILGMNVSAHEIKEYIYGENTLNGFLQIVLTDSNDSTIMTVQLPKHFEDKKDEIKTSLEHKCGLNFYTQMHVLTIEVTCVDESSFKKRKIPLVIDKRKKYIS